MLPGIGEMTVPARVRHDLLMVAKESLTNVAKHAEARSVTVELAESNGCLQLRVSDDGEGFDAAKIFAGSGLRNLRERFENAGGSFKVSSSSGQGTKLTATLPLQNSKER